MSQLQWRQSTTGEWQFLGADGYWHPGSGPGGAGTPGAYRRNNDEATGIMGGVLAIAGGLLLAVGTLLPWVRALDGLISRNGFELGANQSITADGPAIPPDPRVGRPSRESNPVQSFSHDGAVIQTQGAVKNGCETLRFDW